MLTERVDVVYTLADKSKQRDDWELRHSLRSLAEQAWVRDVYLVGHAPKWARDVRHLPHPDRWPALKDANIISKVLRACREEDLSERFVVNSDDHYLLRPVQLADLGPYAEAPGFLEEAARRAKASLWHRRLVHSMSWLREQARAAVPLHCHHPYVVRKSLYVRHMAGAPYSAGPGLHSHVYFPLAAWPEERWPQMPEGWFLSHRAEPTEGQMAAGAARAVFYNHNDSGLGPANKAWLENRFPNPSRWES